MSARPAGTSVSITISPSATPSPAVMPKSPLAGIGEARFVRKLATVVPAARASGIVAVRSPRRTARATASPAFRCSR